MCFHLSSEFYANFDMQKIKSLRWVEVYKTHFLDVKTSPVRGGDWHPYHLTLCHGKIHCSPVNHRAKREIQTVTQKHYVQLKQQYPRKTFKPHTQTLQPTGTFMGRLSNCFVKHVCKCPTR